MKEHLGFFFLLATPCCRGHSTGQGQTSKCLWTPVLIQPALSCPHRGQGYILKTLSSLTLEVELVPWHSQTPQDDSCIDQLTVLSETPPFMIRARWLFTLRHSCPSVFRKEKPFSLRVILLWALNVMVLYCTHFSCNVLPSEEAHGSTLWFSKEERSSRLGETTQTKGLCHHLPQSD